jgi:hypothetical protein
MQTANQDLDEIHWDEYIPRLDAESREFLSEATIPAFFLAYPAFTYGYGEIYGAHNLTGLTREDPVPSAAFPYDWSRQDELFMSRPPANALEVMLPGETPELATVGLAELPANVAASYEPFDTDVLGAWYTYLLFFPIGASDALSIAHLWRGDGALFAVDRETGRGAVIWASAWSTEDAAQRADDALRSIHGVTADAEEPRLGTAIDGEVVWIERAGDRLAFVKNFTSEEAPAIASAALGVSTRSAHRRSRALLHVLLQQPFERAADAD